MYNIHLSASVGLRIRSCGVIVIAYQSSVCFCQQLQPSMHSAAHPRHTWQCHDNTHTSQETLYASNALQCDCVCGVLLFRRKPDASVNDAGLHCLSVGHHSDIAAVQNSSKQRWWWWTTMCWTRTSTRVRLLYRKPTIAAKWQPSKWQPCQLEDGHRVKFYRDQPSKWPAIYKSQTDIMQN